MRKLFAVLVAGIMVMGVLAGCGGSKYKNGEYSAQGDPDKYGNYATVKVVVDGGKITNVEWKELTKDGSEKGENYGKEAGEESYQKAQKALEGSRTYGEKLKETQDVSKVDAVSGATQSHATFKTLVEKALKDAK